VLGAAPLDGTDFALRFSPVTDSCKRRVASFHYHVHLEMVGVPPIARSMATTKSVFGTSEWVQRLATDGVHCRLGQLQDHYLD
jgi:hypothetical protein